MPTNLIKLLLVAPLESQAALRTEQAATSQAATSQAALSSEIGQAATSQAALSSEISQAATSQAALSSETSQAATSQAALRTGLGELSSETPVSKNAWIVPGATVGAQTIETTRGPTITAI